MQLAATLTRNGKTYAADLSRPLDLSIPLEEGLNTVNCFYAPPMETSPVVAGSFVGSTALGGPVNFLNVKLNPHGNGTHTECAGHIALEKITINQCLTRFHFFSKLVSVFPTRMPDSGNRVVLKSQIEEVLEPGEVEALVLRTLPNDERKLRLHHSGTNPPYLDHRAAEWLAECGVKHLLLDLPSVDREEDGGKLLAHHAFWQHPDKTRRDCTITELIYAPPKIKDGLYLLNLQTASFEIDASPSKPVLYALTLES